jgi:Protein of unknown function (DUF2946)
VALLGVVLDDIVRQAMAKWPNVPDCHGWLGLDARGDWYMRDDATQAAGPFPLAKGSRLQHAKLIEFIARNYDSDSAGRWFFQNGPQRVFVELEATPHIARVGPTGICLHTGESWSPTMCLVDEAGLLYVADDERVCRVHTQDMVQAVDWIEQKKWTPNEIPQAELPGRFGYVRSPAAQP